MKYLVIAVVIAVAVYAGLGLEKIKSAWAMIKGEALDICQRIGAWYQVFISKLD